VLTLSALVDWFTRFPALWAATGLLAGVIGTGVAAVFVFRKYGAVLTQANDKLVDIQEKQLDMMERTLQMQKEHYENEITELRKHQEVELAEAKREWQECRQLLHNKREEWTAESLRMQVTIQDLESRPDMRSLNTTLKEIVQLIKAVSSSLDKHDKSIDTRMRQFVKAVKKP
jgi:gas vesicle protein